MTKINVENSPTVAPAFPSHLLLQKAFYSTSEQGDAQCLFETDSS